MNGNVSHCLACSNLGKGSITSELPNGTPESTTSTSKKRSPKNQLRNAFILSWSWKDVLGVAKHHPIPFIFGATFLFFLQVFVVMESMYMYWTWLVEGRTRPCTATVLMFICRGILGCSTQLPLPEGFLGSEADIPTANSPFFLFFSGHVASAVIASLDMRRMQRWELALLFDVLNVMQIVRLLATRGHYTIDLAVGVGAGIFFDSLAAKHEHNMITRAAAVHQL